MPPEKRLHELTGREQEVLALIRAGLTNEEIAERLGVTLAGAKYHVSQILSKLGVATREEAAAAEAAKPPVRAPERRRWWAAWPLAAKAAGAALVLATVAGLGVLAWGVWETGDEAETSDAGDQATPAPNVFRVEGAAMEPLFPNGTQVQVQPYEDRLPVWGDIVVFRPPVVPDRSFIKRIIGLPGELLEIQPSGQVLVNGTPLEEPYVSSLTECSSSTCSWQLPAAQTAEAHDACGGTLCYFVMGDNRQNSSDSRQGWLVPLENIEGWVAPPNSVVGFRVCAAHPGWVQPSLDWILSEREPDVLLHPGRVQGHHQAGL